MKNEDIHLALLAAIKLLGRANQRSPRIRRAAAYLRQQSAALPVNWLTFHDATAAVWSACPLPRRAPDYVSASGSQYWKTDSGVVRLADHWGRSIRSCDWFLAGAAVQLVALTGEHYEEIGVSNQLAVAHCKWSAFSKKTDYQVTAMVQATAKVAA